MKEGVVEEDVRAVILALEACGWMSLHEMNEDMLVDEIMDHLEKWPHGTMA